MKTETTNGNNYPFEIESEAITTEFALFNVMTHGREEIVLVLSPNNINSAISDREFAFTDQKRQECIAQGYFSYAGGKPNQNRWISKIEFNGNEGMNKAAMDAIRNDVWGEVYKLFKGKPAKNGGSAEERATDVRPTEAHAKRNDVTERLGVAWLEEAEDEPDELPNNSELTISPIDSNIRPVEPTALIRKTALNKGRHATVI